MPQLLEPMSQAFSKNDSVSELLAREDYKTLEKFRFTFDGIHMWPFIRGTLMWHCRNRMEGLGYESLMSKPPENAEKKKQALQNLTVDNIYSEIDKLDPSQAIVFAYYKKYEALHNQKRNLYSWPFEETLGQVTLVEESDTGEISTHHNNILWHEKLFHIGRLKAKNVPLAKADANSVAELIYYLKLVFGDLCSEEIWSKLKGQLEVLATRLVSWKPVYMHLFQRVNPKCVVIYNASFGHRSYLVYWLKQMGIPVLELQHGNLIKAIPTYRFHNITQQHWFSTYLPDHMLLWGGHWKDNYEAEISKLVVGNPLFLEHQKSFSTSQQQVLVCLNGLNTEIGITLLDKIATRFKKHKFKLRLHPVVRANWRFWTERLPDNCFFCEDSSNRSLYEDLAEASILIAEPSTVVYEASQLGIPTYLLKTQDVNYPVPNAESLLDLDYLPDEQTIKPDHQIYFGLDWKSDFKKHLNWIVFREASESKNQEGFT